MNDNILKSIVSAISSGLNSNFTVDHHFLVDGTCETFIKLMIKYFAVYDSIRKELVVSVGRLSKNNSYMQVKLVEWGVLKPIIEILRCYYKDTELMKTLCWCICCLVLDNPDNQLKFATLNGFKVVGLVLKVIEDLNTLRSILKMIAPLVHNNITAQAKCYQENIVTILSETKSELQRIDSESLSTDTKNSVSNTLLAIEYTLDHIQVLDNNSTGNSVSISSNRPLVQSLNADGDETPHETLHNDLADGHHNMNMVEVLHQRMLARRNALDNNPNHNQVRQTLDLLGLPPDVADRAAIRLMRAAVRHQENINQNNTD